MFVQEATPSLNELNHRKLLDKAPYIGALFDLFLPNHCLICAQTLEAGKILCETCLNKLQALTPTGTYKNSSSIEKIYFYDYYDSPLTELIKSYKYGPHKSLERFLAYFLSLLLSYWELNGTIIPVPSHIASIRSRGFSSVENIVECCRKTFRQDLEMLPIIRRKGNYIPQASIADQNLRKENAKQSYTIVESEIPEQIIIVDDIMTSGNTLEAVASLIKSKGTDCQITGVVFVKRGR
jgi:ComF family protein